jgi:ABC-type glutathione transport system ATPase component
MTTTPSTSDLTDEEKGKVGLGNPPVLAETSETVLSGRGLIKTFGRVVGLDGVNVDLFPGEVLAVIGDNGAGKSTLIKALTGALIPDAGQVFLDGTEVHFKTPQDARSSGIETVYRHWRSRRLWTSPPTCSLVGNGADPVRWDRFFACSTRRA